MSEHFARYASKIMISDWAKEVGFIAISDSSLETLADIFERYIMEIGFNAKNNAEFSGRNESSFVDVEIALKEVGVTMEDLITKVLTQEESSIPRDFPPFPIKKETQYLPENKRVKLDPHIPTFFPPFPDVHTYNFSNPTKKKKM